MIDRIAFVVGETLIGLRRNIPLSIAAIVTSAVALYVLAGMAYLGRQAAGYVDDVQSRFEMTVNLKEGTKPAGVERTAKYLRLMPGVANVVWIPGAKRWEKDRKLHPELTEGYGFSDNIYPDALRVRLNDLTKGDAIAAKARQMTTVDRQGGVQYFPEAQNTVARWIAVGRTLAVFLGGGLLLVAGIVIFNAVLLTVEARKAEIRIMRLVGASRIVIALPLIFEGVAQGALGAALATWGLQATHRSVEALLKERSMVASLAPFPTLFVLALLCGLGGGYGGVCSLVALLKSLRARQNR